MTVTRRTVRWHVGDVFLVPQTDGLYTLGQVVDRMMGNTSSCAFYATRVPTPTMPDLVRADVFAALSVVPGGLTQGAWPIVGHREVQLERSAWPNEQFRKADWVGATTYSSLIVEDFLNAFFGLAPWDKYLDPAYFERLLSAPDWKPKTLVSKRQVARES